MIQERYLNTETSDDMKKVTVVGSSNTDMVVKSGRLPLPGETIVGDSFLMNAGGKGANQAVAIARLGIPTTFVARIGNDMFGQESKVIFENEGINVKYVCTDEENPSGVALITVDEHGENSIVVAAGANAKLSVDDIEMATKEIESSNYLLMQLEIPMQAVEAAANIAHTSGVKIVLNPAPAQYISCDLLEKLYIITPNRGEAELLTGIKILDIETAKEAAMEIIRKGVQNVIITLGSIGSLVCENGEFTLVEAFKVEAIDTTAAGDTFNGALCVGLTEGMTLIEAVVFASKAAAIAVTRMGAQSSIPTRDEICTFK